MQNLRRALGTQHPEATIPNSTGDAHIAAFARRTKDGQKDSSRSSGVRRSSRFSPKCWNKGDRITGRDQLGFAASRMPETVHNGPRSCDLEFAYDLCHVLIPARLGLVKLLKAIGSGNPSHVSIPLVGLPCNRVRLAGADRDFLRYCAISF